MGQPENSRLTRIIERQTLLIESLRGENDRLRRTVAKYEGVVSAPDIKASPRINTKRILVKVPEEEPELFSPAIEQQQQNMSPKSPLETFHMPPPPKENPHASPVIARNMPRSRNIDMMRQDIPSTPPPPLRTTSRESMYDKTSAKQQDQAPEQKPTRVLERASEKVRVLNPIVIESPSAPPSKPIVKKSMDSVDGRASFLYSILDQLRVNVPNSSVHLNEDSREYTAYVITLHQVTGVDGAPPKELWRLEKRYSDFLQLHDYLRHTLPAAQMALIGKIPKASFKSQGVAPSKADSRRLALQSYIHAVVTTGPSKTIFRFPSSDLVTAREEKFIFTSVLEGYMVKKGRRLLSWKRRYFALINEYLHYWDSKEEAAACALKSQNNEWHVDYRPSGTLHLKHAKISKQKQNSVNEYRHAMMIRENGERKSILCAESDAERDEWVFYLVQQIEKVRDSYEEEPLLKEDVIVEVNALTPAPFSLNRDSAMLGRESTVQHKRNSHVFGALLEDAISFAKVKEGYELPAVVFRCIEFLEAKRAYTEEGIYRQNGNANVMEQLSGLFERGNLADSWKFETYCDLRWGCRADQDGRVTDVYAVSGLLKKFLRELPDPILTANLHKSFLNVMDLLDRSDKIMELARLVSLLPLPNYTLIRSLISHFIRIVRHSDVNKMTARNMAIILAPTLGIPTGIFTLMMAEFEFVFWVKSDPTNAAASSDLEQHQQPAVAADDFETLQERSLEMAALPPSSGPQKSKRSSWRAEEHQVKGRSNRNSLVFEKNAPESVRFYETWITADQLEQEDGVKVNALQAELEELEDCDDDLYDASVHNEEGYDANDKHDSDDAHDDQRRLADIASESYPFNFEQIHEASEAEESLMPDDPFQLVPLSMRDYAFESQQKEQQKRSAESKQRPHSPFSSSRGDFMFEVPPAIVQNRRNSSEASVMEADDGSSLVFFDPSMVPLSGSAEAEIAWENQNNNRISTVLNSYDRQNTARSSVFEARPESVVCTAQVERDSDEEVVSYDYEYSEGHSGTSDSADEVMVTDSKM